ncbi:CUB and sushi domain-containing protein 3 [Holothuria leucospilota]|uniref:CUB and sushi domain-containing protein 3 n=1 Tax=Holothuria leucospilota TaxID=206669 RepID=A0A9Q1C4X2_HOLLE|nr:CUB and sushi domain-containing protein 3 [Holothuria leucospilota]
MVCLPLGCGHPGNIEHGRAEGRVYSVRSSVTYVCDIGYKLQGNATRHCQADQKWSGDLPKCIIIASESCSNSDLPYGLLAEGESNRQGFTPNNDWLRVQCEDNLQLSGGHLLKCENGEWKKTTSCDGKSATCHRNLLTGNGLKKVIAKMDSIRWKDVSYHTLAMKDMWQQTLVLCMPVLELRGIKRRNPHADQVMTTK